MAPKHTEQRNSNREALSRVGNLLIAAMVTFVELPSKEHAENVARLMFQYQTIYELCELP